MYKDDWPDDHLEFADDNDSHDDNIAPGDVKGNCAMRTNLVNTVFSERI